MDNEALRRCSILLLSVGEEAASEVLKHMGSREVQLIGASMAALKQVSHEEVAKVLEDFRDEADQFIAVNLGTDDYVRAVLTRALGADRAAGVLEDILDSGESASGVDALNWLEPATVAELIRDEHPQIIATILVHLERARAAEALALLPERLRHDVVMRIATFGGVQPAALNELTEVLNEVFSGHGTKRSRMGGVRTAAEIINMMASSIEETVMDSLRQRDPDLAQRIIDEMFVFENLGDLEDRSIQLLLKEVENETLLLALKGAPEVLRMRFLRNMSSRAADLLREDLDAMGPVRLSVVETEQKRVLDIARRLAEAGQINLTSKDNEAYV
ncbi:MAG: flagellar motor switch protein FliG [Pigmentiphaga sp.]